MATHKSAEKRARQAVKRNARNTQAAGTVRTTERKLRTALGANDKAAATTLMSEYMSTMAKAGTKGVVHKKTASRKIGRLAARLSKLGTTGSSVTAKPLSKTAAKAKSAAATKSATK